MSCLYRADRAAAVALRVLVVPELPLLLESLGQAEGRSDNRGRTPVVRWRELL
jgi:hypothetical protein